MGISGYSHPPISLSPATCLNACLAGGFGGENAGEPALPVPSSMLCCVLIMPDKLKETRREVKPHNEAKSYISYFIHHLSSCFFRDVETRQYSSFMKMKVQKQLEIFIKGQHASQIFLYKHAICIKVELCKYDLS